jgi:hypothetical protein
MNADQLNGKWMQFKGELKQFAIGLIFPFRYGQIKARFLREASLLLQTSRCFHCVVRGQRSSITSF